MTGHRLRQGVIRPREFILERTNKQSFEETKEHGFTPIARRRMLVALTALAAVCLFGLHYRSSVSAYSAANNYSARNLRFSDENVENTASGEAPKDHNVAGLNVKTVAFIEGKDESEDDTDWKSKENMLIDEDNEEQEKEEEEKEEDDEEDDDASEEDLNEAIEAGKEVAVSSNNAVKSDQSAAKQQGLLLQQQPRLTLDSYLHNTGNKAVDISNTGSYKFVLVKATDYTGASAYLVKGCPVELGSKCKHPTAFKLLKQNLAKYGIVDVQIHGGGRITRHVLKKPKVKVGVISIFGYSKTYKNLMGLKYDEATNRKVCELIYNSKDFKEKFVVKYSNEGYNESDEYKIKSFNMCSV